VNNTNNPYRLGDLVCLRPEYLTQGKKKRSDAAMVVEYIQSDTYAVECLIGTTWFEEYEDGSSKIRRDLFPYQWLEYHKHRERRRKIGLID
jgi:hypothetical protein